MMGLRSQPPPETLASKADFPLPTAAIGSPLKTRDLELLSARKNEFRAVSIATVPATGKMLTADPEADAESDKDSFEQSERHFGLGLDNVRQVMAAHHGFVWARNHENQGGGAGFYLFLPAYTPPKKRQSKKTRARQNTSKGADISRGQKG